MICAEARELIQLYMDSELDSRDTLEVQQHLAGCSACSSLLDWLLKQDELLRESARAEARDNAHILEQIVAAVRRESGWAANPRLRVLRAAAAVLAAVAVAGLLVYSGLLTGHNSPVYAAVVADHLAHCTLDKLAMAETDCDKLDRLVREYGKLARTPDLSAFGFADPRAKVCKVSGSPILHIVFHDGEGLPLSLFVRPHNPDLQKLGLTSVESAGRRVLSLSRSGVDVFVVSSADDERTSAIAAVVASLLEQISGATTT